MDRPDFLSAPCREMFRRLYAGDAAAQPARYAAAYASFTAAFGDKAGVRMFSAPGRSELSGNHTDHQLGRVLAAAVTLDMLAAARPRDDGRVCICSEGYPPFSLTLCDTAARACERETSAGLVRGVADWLVAHGYRTGGFDAYVTSAVPKGSGLSSSAAYSILICTIFSYLYNDGRVSSVEQAFSGKHAENVYFGKPSGLMDQLASASGGFVAIDFQDPDAPGVERIDCDLAAHGYGVCIVNAGGSHANLTNEYAAVPAEMGAVAAFYGQTHLRGVDEDAFYRDLPKLRKAAGDRAVLRAMHFFRENARVYEQTDALRTGDIDTFRRLMLESGRSSFELLQNVCPRDPSERSIALALALSERLLAGRGAWRIHGGGFAGTVQALVPLSLVDAYAGEMERVFGQGCCYRLAVRPVGGAEAPLR